MVTLKDIADKTGYSVAVVSRALNPHPDQQVASHTRKTIERAVGELGYRPNHAASFLRKGRSAAIGVFLPEVGNELVGALINGLARVANRAGFAYNLYFDTHKDDYEEFLRRSQRVKNAGVVTYMPYTREHAEPERLEELSAAGCTVILLNSPELPIQNVTSVCIDNHHGGALAAERLLAAGCGRFLHPVMARPSWQLAQRAEGFARRLAEAGREAELFCLERSSRYVVADAAFDRLLAEIAAAPGGVCGVFAATDYEAISLYQRLQAANLGDRIGRSIKIVGFDGIVGARLLRPALTTIAQPFEALGEIGMALLLRSLVKADIPVDRERLKPTLLARESA